jgi:hypothetical protein
MTPLAEDRPIVKTSLNTRQRNTQNEIYMRASNEIQTRDPSVAKI